MIIIKLQTFYFNKKRINNLHMVNPVIVNVNRLLNKLSITNLKKKISKFTCMGDSVSYNNIIPIA